MAKVYLAYDNELGIDIALKKLKNEAVSEHENAFDRFKREFAVLSSLAHPNLIKTYELLYTSDGEPFLTMEYVKGELLADLISRNELSFTDKLTIILQIARALSEVHSKGIIHRDIKPSNIIIQDELHVKLLDFGISRYIEEEQVLTKSGELVGSPHYISPEQIMREADIDHRADIYSFGITVFELFAGQKPFNQEHSLHLTGSHLVRQPPPLRQLCAELPVWLETMVSTCLQKKPENRYQKMSDLIDKIEDEQGRLERWQWIGKIKKTFRDYFKSRSSSE